MEFRKRLGTLGEVLGGSTAFAVVLGILALPLRWGRWLAVLTVPGLVWLLLSCRINEIRGNPGATDWEPIRLGLGLATMLLLAAISGVDELPLVILQSQGTEIIASLNFWPVLFDIMIPMTFSIFLAIPLALVMACALAWQRRRSERR